MKGAIIYRGKYGATAQYAAWLSQALGVPAVKAEDSSSADLSSFDFLILGGSVYIGRFQLKDWLTEHLAALRDKRLFLFIVCGTPPDQKEALQKIVRENIPPELGHHGEIFFFPGRVIRKNISWTDRLLLRLGAVVEKDAAAKYRMSHDFDKVNAASLNPLINAVNAERTNKDEWILAGKPLK